MIHILFNDIIEHKEEVRYDGTETVCGRLKPDIPSLIRLTERGQKTCCLAAAGQRRCVRWSHWDRASGGFSRLEKMTVETEALLHVD